MDKFLAVLLKGMSLFSVVTQVAQATHDKGSQSILKASLSAVNGLVQSGHLPHSINEGIEEILPAIIENHPLVQNPVPAAVEVVPVPAAPAQLPAGFDYDALAAAMTRLQTRLS